MATPPNKLSQFWQELKRRNVVRVVTVYTGAAFVILSLVDMIREPFELPNWSFKLVLVILCVGLIIAVILSWIYDINPEGGMVKTEPADKIKPEEPLRTSKGWKIASYISFIVIVGLIVINIIPRSEKKEILDKSIAVLPFINDSPAPKNSSINGYMTALHNNLCQVKELRVLSLQSTEKYRNGTKSITEIAKELEVGYLLTARGQILNNNIQLTVQLVDASDDIIWSNPYNRYIESVEDHIDIQSEIAQLVASKLQTTIAPEEKQRIENIPTNSLTAYDLYQRGKEELWNYNININNAAVLDKADKYFHEALEIDSAFSLAYLGLARIYRIRNRVPEYLSENFLDSVLIFTNFALKYDKDLADAYVFRGDYNRDKGFRDKALQDYNHALDINSNAWEAYVGKAILYYNNDIVATIDNLQKAISINRGKELPILLGYMGSQFDFAGFPESAKAYYKDKLVLDGDTTTYLDRLGDIETHTLNLENAIKYYHQGYLLDSTNSSTLFNLWTDYSYIGQFEEALRLCEKWLIQLDSTLITDFRINGMHRVGYVYWHNNQHDKASDYFDLQLEICNWEINSDLPEALDGWSYYDRAAVYAFRGNRIKAYEDLKKLDERTRFPAWFNTHIKMDPLFDSIRNETAFQQIVRDVEAKYQAEHERVKQWLEDNEML